VFQVRLQKKTTSTLSKDVVNRFVPDGSVSEGKSAGKLPESEGTVVCLIKYVKKNYKAGHRPLWKISLRSIWELYDQFLVDGAVSFVTSVLNIHVIFNIIPTETQIPTHHKLTISSDMRWNFYKIHRQVREVIAHKFRRNNENFKIKWIFGYNETYFREIFAFLSNQSTCAFATPAEAT
jgi:hypothetical protein